MRSSVRPATEQAQTGRGRGRRAANGDPIPVLTATAGRADVPVYLDALGTVQAFNTVSIKPMIDGPLVAVLFKEGQDVHAGDVLARIDPRPYQAALDQVAAKKAQDEANLANARVDLARYQKLVATAYTSAQTSDTQRATVAQDEAIVKQDQAQIDTARTNLSYTTIVSPLDGRTGIRQVDSGNIVHAADTTPLTVDHPASARLGRVQPAAADAGRRRPRLEPGRAGGAGPAAGRGRRGPRGAGPRGWWRCWTTRWTRRPGPSS